MTIEQIIINLSKYPKDTEVIYNNITAITEQGLIDLTDDSIGVIPELHKLYRWLERIGNPHGWVLEETIDYEEGIEYILSKTIDNIDYKISTCDGSSYIISNDKVIIELTDKDFQLILNIIKNPIKEFKNLLKTSQSLWKH